jgi:hypothetical protein
METSLYYFKENKTPYKRIMSIKNIEIKEYKIKRKKKI